MLPLKRSGWEERLLAALRKIAFMPTTKSSLTEPLGWPCIQFIV
jgi:hypothetical protein